MKKSFQVSLLLVFLLAMTFLEGHCGGQSFEEKEMTDQRIEEMIQTLVDYGIKNERVLTAMRKVRRHEFIPLAYRDMAEAYGDHPCSIGYGQTISQPYIVAYMTEKMNPQPGEKILEIGTGSGYQAAVLAQMGARVFTIEIVPQLAAHADEVLKNQNFPVMVKHGDGYQGWPEFAPFDVVIVTCAPENIPKKLVEQLNTGGRMIIPVGPVNSVQNLLVIRKTTEGTSIEEDLPVRFVPMVTDR
jgi:protein-L-isoaspartate(D-aspartate) O-methyltransferase